MAKKPKRKVKKYSGKTEKEWRDWGEKFGKRIEKRGKEFAEEVEDLGERLEKRFERRNKKLEKEWWFISFGFIGPLLGSIFGIICLALGIIALNIINMPLRSSFISSVSYFFLSNLPWFFGAFLFFGYNDYFSKRYPKSFWIVEPITTAIGITILAWIAIFILNLINTSVGNVFITSVSNFLYRNLLGIFVVFLVLGYIIVIIKKLIMSLLRI
jgi:hypothetical protein